MAIVKKISYKQTIESMKDGEELEFSIKEASRNALVLACKRVGDVDENEGRPRRIFSTRMDKNNRLKFYLKREK